MARKPPRPPSSKPEASADDEREKERRAFVETMAGYGMPLPELGLLLVPSLSEDEIKVRYARELETGAAKAKANLVNLIWQTAKKSATVQIYLSKVMLGWNEKAGLPEKPEQPDNTEAKPALTPSAKEIEAAILSFPGPQSRRSSE